MSILGDLLAQHTVLPDKAVGHLHALVREWQLLADLSFADYLMWVPRDGDPSGALICVAQSRPNTAPTVLPNDMVGTVATAEESPMVIGALESGVIGRHSTGAEQNIEAVPVRYAGQVIAALTHQRVLASGRKTSRLEVAYLNCAQDLVQMVSEGTFPGVNTSALRHSNPRVGDGFIRLDEHGLIAYASPNAVSAYRRMGFTPKLVSYELVAITRPLIVDPAEAQEFAGHVHDALIGDSSTQFEFGSARAVMLVWTLPLVVHGSSTGAMVLIRDVTEVKRRDRALLSKDATIREIHHRVKNNLQTVAALLRMQARRTTSAEVREALSESVRRVSSIALVHDALSMSADEEVNLDEVIDRILPIMNDVASVDAPIRISRVGTLGVLDADRATALTMVLTELVQNAIEHAFDPAAAQRCVTISTERSTGWLDVVVHDDGHGLPVGFSPEKSEGLGFLIVGTLVSAELDGSLTTRNAPGGGADIVLHIPLSGSRLRSAQPPGHDDAAST